MLHYQEKPASSNLKVLIISDSYTWQWCEQKYMQNTFGDWSFWFYNNTMYPESFSSKKTTADINYNETLLKKDVIIVMAAEGTLDLFPYNLLEKTEEIYQPKAKAALIEYYKMKMKADKSWYDSIVKKAEEKKITVDEAIQIDAEWLADKEIKDHHN